MGHSRGGGAVRTEVMVIRAQGETFQLSVCPSLSCLEALWTGWLGWVLPRVLAEAPSGFSGQGVTGHGYCLLHVRPRVCGVSWLVPSAAAAAPEKRLLWDEKVLSLLAAPPARCVRNEALGRRSGDVVQCFVRAGVEVLGPPGPPFPGAEWKPLSCPCTCWGPGWGGEG